MAQYSEELETKFREGSRGKNIANTPLGELIAGRVDTYSERAKKNAIDYFEDIIDLTPEELKDKPELFREAMVGSSYEQYGKNKGNDAQKLLSGIMEDAGAESSWPRKTLLSELGRDKANELFDLEPIRRNVRFDDDVFKNLKKSMVILSNQNDTQAVAQLALHAFGGFRPSDLKGIKVEDIDFRTGEVQATIKTKGATQLTTGYFAPPLLDAIKLHVGNRKQGLVFEDVDANVKRINPVLADVFGPEAIVSRSEKTGETKTSTMHVKELRNLNESLLTTQGVEPNSEARKALTFRLPSSVAGKYAASTANRRVMREMVAKNVSMIAGYSETPNVSQFFADVGIPASNTTRQIAVTQGTLEMFEGYSDTLSREFVESIPEGDGIGFASPVKADPEMSAAFKESTMAELGKRTAESKAQEAQTIIESAPDIEQAEKIKAGQRKERQEAQAKIKAEELEARQAERRAKLKKALAAAKETLKTGGKAVGVLAIGDVAARTVSAAMEGKYGQAAATAAELAVPLPTGEMYEDIADPEKRQLRQEQQTRYGEGKPVFGETVQRGAQKVREQVGRLFNEEEDPEELLPGEAPLREGAASEMEDILRVNITK